MSQLITTSETLDEFCTRVHGDGYVTVDTEFIREKTYYPQLCLVQVAGEAEAAVIDPLAPGMDLSPLLRLLANSDCLKVFHAGRQDIEIFLHLTGRIPTPLFDTQIAAMVCGFGEAVSYEQLVLRLTGAQIDKSSRFTDWSLRPLTDRQIDYALADVTCLRPVYRRLAAMLAKNGRSEWLADEIAVITDPQTYRTQPADAWRRFRLRGNEKPHFLGILKTLADWREREAQTRDVPRGRILRDEAVLEIAAHAPASVDELARIRSLGRSVAEGRFGQSMLEAIRCGAALSKDDLPRPALRVDPVPGTGATVELLKVLLKFVAEQEGVAARLIATTADLEEIAGSDTAKVAALEGWRRAVFGLQALRLKNGTIALAISDGKIRLVEV